MKILVTTLLSLQTLTLSFGLQDAFTSSGQAGDGAGRNLRRSRAAVIDPASDFFLDDSSSHRNLAQSGVIQHAETILPSGSPTITWTINKIIDPNLCGASTSNVLPETWSGVENSNGLIRWTSVSVRKPDGLVCTYDRSDTNLPLNFVNDYFGDYGTKCLQRLRYHPKQT